MTARTHLGYQVATLAFAHPATLLRVAPLLPAMSLKHLARASLLGLTSLVAWPLGVVEELGWGGRIRRTRLVAPPVFIMGYWCSGVTRLHDLMVRDARFGSVSMPQTVLPSGGLLGGRWLERVLAHVAPAGRQGNELWPMTAPQVEEIALGKMVPYAFYAPFLFPTRARALFRRHVMLEGLPPRAVARWMRAYVRLLQVATIRAPGRRLLLKNPVNTARLRLLLELFPDAKFVHVHRSPYDVFPRVRELHRALLALSSLEDARAPDVEETVYALYEDMIGRYLDDRALVPRHNLVEIRFADLERDPLGTLRCIYDRLRLPGHGAAASAARDHLAARTGRRERPIAPITPVDAARIERRWGFAFDAFGYERIAEIDVAPGSARIWPASRRVTNGKPPMGER